MFKQFVGSSAPDILFCPLCKDEKLLYIQKLKFYRCPKCGEEFDEIKRFTMRKRKLIAPNSDEYSGILLSQVTAGEFQSRTNLQHIRNTKYHSPKEAWDADDV